MGLVCDWNRTWPSNAEVLTIITNRATVPHLQSHPFLVSCNRSCTFYTVPIHVLRILKFREFIFTCSNSNSNADSSSSSSSNSNKNNNNNNLLNIRWIFTMGQIIIITFLECTTILAVNRWLCAVVYILIASTNLSNLFIVCYFSRNVSELNWQVFTKWMKWCVH